VITGFLGLALAYVIAGSIGVIGVTVIPGIVYGVLICVIAAFPMALLGIIPQSIVADVAEADGYETGEQIKQS
ncbi:MAG: sodium:solute symporter, partial [Ruminococcus sp.]|nr:sodium:solute symporter [Ruminococcus sp.]